MFDFPANPVDGQKFTPPGGPNYVFATPYWKFDSPTTVGEAPLDANYYGRHNAQWSDVTEEAPADGKHYARTNGGWTTVAVTDDAPNDGLTYGRRSNLWATIVGGAVVSDTAPTGVLQAGQMWWESDTGSLYIYYDDGDSKQWVMLVPGTPGSPQITADLNMQGFSILNLLNLNGSPAANLWFTDPRFLAAANGYFVLPALKLGIQWGSVAGGADNAVTFPIAFAAAPYAVIATAVGTLTAAQVVTDMVTNVTATGFTCQPRYTSVPVAGTQGQVTVGIAGQGANWIAIGRFP